MSTVPESTRKVYARALGVLLFLQLLWFGVLDSTWAAKTQGFGYIAGYTLFVSALALLIFYRDMEELFLIGAMLLGGTVAVWIYSSIQLGHIKLDIDLLLPLLHGICSVRLYSFHRALKSRRSEA